MYQIGFAAPILFRLIKQLIAGEMRCSPPHDFHHGGLHSHMQGACELHRGVAGRAGENKVCKLGSFSNGYSRIQQENQTVRYRSGTCASQTQAQSNAQQAILG